ncbi:MAG: class I SAM-dependent methyltransferase [Verrucomicrobiae bacterium]|nr:class I SAM-dependent methyltransferase [Verrucomicrobiae bacterium]
MKTFIKSIIYAWFASRPHRVGQVRRLAQQLSPYDSIMLEYPVVSKSRWSGTNPHSRIKAIFDSRLDFFSSLLASWVEMKSAFWEISRHREDAGKRNPSWINGWMPALDGVAIYGHIGKHRPQTYLEVGSGCSTKFARKAIEDAGLTSSIISIDPHPRSDIDALCDDILRTPLEFSDLSVFSKLEANDIVYIDCSHRAFMNSDVTAFFLDVLPNLPPGVVVGIHDIFLPFDYPEDWKFRWYSEQYLLACYLLAGCSRMTVTCPSYYVSQNRDLKAVLAPLWDHPCFHGVETHGCSFWFQMT